MNWLLSYLSESFILQTSAEAAFRLMFNLERVYFACKLHLSTFHRLAFGRKNSPGSDKITHSSLHLFASRLFRRRLILLVWCLKVYYPLIVLFWCVDFQIFLLPYHGRPRTEGAINFGTKRCIINRAVALFLHFPPNWKGTKAWQ